MLNKFDTLFETWGLTASKTCQDTLRNSASFSRFMSQPRITIRNKKRTEGNSAEMTKDHTRFLTVECGNF